ncbi:MAG: GGDEF domain-containing protein, partial [Candidatus Izimaplasma sp.]|nr:GGDEF domain-containing protein [Candidatus Izimaplasma bacterium]
LYHLELQHTLERKSYRDHLTGIGNRRKFDKELAEAFENYTRYEHPFALVIIDIDHFKDLNDKYGHLAGDKALMKLSETVSKRVRKTDYFCRIGGDEFVVLLKESDDDNIQQFISDVKHRIQENEFLSDKDVSITTGYSIMSEKIENKDELFELADQNLYQNKKEH